MLTGCPKFDIITYKQYVVPLCLSSNCKYLIAHLMRLVPYVPSTLLVLYLNLRDDIEVVLPLFEGVMALDLD